MYFQDTTILISSFTSHPSGYSFSVSFLVLLHLPDSCPGMRPWTAFLFYLPTWLLHPMSNRQLEFNLPQTEPLISSFRIVFSTTVFPTSVNGHSNLLGCSGQNLGVESVVNKLQWRQSRAPILPQKYWKTSRNNQNPLCQNSGTLPNVYSNNQMLN